MNEVQFVKYQNENKMVNIKTLPSCRWILLLHSKTANDVACIWGLYTWGLYSEGKTLRFAIC